MFFDVLAKKSLSSVISHVKKALARRLHNNFKEAGFPITSEQWEILVHLWNQDGRSQQQLACCTHTDQPGITRLIDNMEKNKLVERRADNTDRRVKLIFLTEYGKIVKSELIKIYQNTQYEAIVNIEPDRILQSLTVLLEIEENLNRAENGI